MSGADTKEKEYNMNKVKAFFIKKKSAILHLLGSLVMLAIAAVIGIMLGLNKTNNINKYIDEAVEYFGEANWVALFQYAEVIDNDFINENSFSQTAETVFGDVSAENVVIEDIDENENDASVKVSYTTSDGESLSCELQFDKKDKKNYMFFPQWKLDIEHMIAKECSLTVENGFTVYLDGIELTVDNAKISRDDEAGTYTYVIPRIFKGEHVIYLQKEGFEVIEANVTWDENESSYVMNIADLVLVKSQQDAINASSKDIVVGMYSAIFNESGTNDIQQYFSQDEAVLTALEGVYDSMLEAINPDDGSTLNSIDITAFNYDSLVYEYPDKVNVTVSFECEFAARGARDKKGGVREKYSGTSSSEIKLEFVKSGDSWLCKTLEMTCIDYSKQEE